jgi:Ca2+-binding EF-hand superfamily protein
MDRVEMVKEVAKRMFDAVDGNKNGEIDATEFKTLCDNVRRGLADRFGEAEVEAMAPINDMKDMFRAADRNKDGVLDFDECWSAFTRGFGTNAQLEEVFNGMKTQTFVKAMKDAEHMVEAVESNEFGVIGNLLDGEGSPYNSDDDAYAHLAQDDDADGN